VFEDNVDVNATGDKDGSQSNPERNVEVVLYPKEFVFICI
jgi:hypothetical protein